MIKLLDLYCGGGRCSMGYYHAAQDLGIGIQIIGVDINPQKNYPFDFVQADALDFLRKNAHWCTHIHASPPCQKYSRATSIARMKGYNYPDLLQPTIQAIEGTGITAVVENVVPAPMRPDLRLRGDMFGLKVLRERKFQLIGWFCMQPGLPSVRKGAVVKYGDYVSVFGHGNRFDKKRADFKYDQGSIKKTWSYAMGIDWMTVKQLAESVPPAYTRYIGNQWWGSYTK